MEVQHVARNTDLHLRNQMIYSVFVRNYSPEGTFEKVREDLPRIRDLGADIFVAGTSSVFGGGYTEVGQRVAQLRAAIG